MQIISHRQSDPVDLVSICLSALLAQGKRKEYIRKPDYQTESASPKIDENLKIQLQETFWVQCEKITCRKWRRLVGRDELRMAEAEPKWSCGLHPDPRFRSCAVAEEDTNEYDRLANTVGLIYVKDWLPPGSLVWARLPGFCSWPAVLTGDRSCGGQYMERDEVGGAYSYHVEFLGHAHSHSWVRATSVLEFIPGQPAPTREPHRSRRGGRGRGGGSRRARVPCHCHRPKPRCPPGLEEAVQEASALVHLSLEERLSRCRFHGPVAMETGETLTVRDEAPVTRSSRKATQEQGARGRPMKQREQTQTSDCSQAASCRGKHGKAKAVRVQRKSVALQTDCLPSASPVMHSKPCTRQQTSAIQDPTDGALPSTLTFQSHSLLNRTNEERLCLDIEMYRRNESAFKHDVNRLRLRHDLDLIRTRKWSGRPISPFQVFLSVHNRGGFVKVKQSRQWAAIYKELTDTHASSGHCVASFYYRYLYAYELFVQGVDFDHVIRDNMRSRRKTERKGKTQKKISAPRATADCSPTPSGEELFSDDEDDSSFTACGQGVDRALHLLDRDDTYSCIQQDWEEGEQVVPGKDNSMSEGSCDTLLALSQLQSCLLQCHCSLLEL